MAEGKVPSDVVELIIAVDLNPSNPEEPINVKSAEVAPKGGDDASDTKLVEQLLAAVSKMDPDIAMAIGKAGDNPRAAVREIEKLSKNAPEHAQDEAEPFDRAMEQKPKRPAPEPREDFSRPEKPKQDENGSWRQHGESSFEPKKKFGGFRGASDHAFKKPDAEDFADHGADEDQEDEFGNKKKKEW